MSQAVEVDGDGYRIRWDDDIEAVVHTWTRYVSGDAFQDGCNRLLEVIREHDASKLLVDQREFSALDDGDMEWLMEEWTPEATAAGLAYSVVLIPESVIAEMNMERVAEKAAEMDADQDMATDIDEARQMVREY